MSNLSFESDVNDIFGCFWGPCCVQLTDILWIMCCLLSVCYGPFQPLLVVYTKYRCNIFSFRSLFVLVVVDLCCAIGHTDNCKCIPHNQATWSNSCTTKHTVQGGFQWYFMCTATPNIPMLFDVLKQIINNNNKEQQQTSDERNACQKGNIEVLDDSTNTSESRPVFLCSNLFVLLRFSIGLVWI